METKSPDADCRMYPIRRLTPHFGVECMDVDLSKVDLNDESSSHLLMRQIKQDLVEHRVVLFRQQELSGQQQVDLSNALGTVESTFYKHPKSPHADIFRVSNNEEEGCTHVGRSGWHIDGTFQMKPFMYQTMYFPSVSQGGDTHFIPLKELYDGLSPQEQEYYNTLWMVTGRRQAPIHPLICQHPFRPNGEKTMLFHCGRSFVQGWHEDVTTTGTDGVNRVKTNVNHMVPAETIQEKLTSAIESRFDEIGLRMKWEQGDFMINDNLGLAHYASDGTQANAQTVGLRVLHRTTITGGPETIPQKADGRQSFTPNNSPITW
jgi:alpha-ketoglutarate-dependent taurine dioxygenase